MRLLNQSLNKNTTKNIKKDVKMRKIAFTKILSLLLIVGMLFSIAPMTANAENLPQEAVPYSATNAEIKLSGVVKDGGIFEGDKHGYPLYAKITVTGPGGAQVLYSDPFTGAYEIMIESDVEYTVSVEAQLSGYIMAQQTITPTANTVLNFDLNISESCTAPGYQPDYDIFYDFEGSEQGFTFGGTNSSWAWGEFTSGPGYAISGTHGIATNPAGQYNTSELSWAMSPVLDLSVVPVDATVFLDWWNWLFTESATSTWDVASVEFTTNGTTWTTVWGPTPRQDTAYRQERIIIDDIYLVDTFQFRFWFKSDFSGNRDGWYIDDIGVAWIELTNPPIPVAEFYFDGAAGEEEWTTGSTGSGANSWAKGVPTSGPGAAYSNPNVWATNLSGNYNASEVSFITSPVIDLSTHTGKAIVVEWMDWLRTESVSYNWDVARLYASKDGGATFNLLMDNIKRQDTVGGDYKAQRFEIPSEYATNQFHFRFEFKSDSSGQHPGWYIDDVKFSASDPIAVPCVTAPGGIVAGWVYDLNIEDADVPVMGALVATESGSGTTMVRPDDEANDGLYYFFQPTTGAVAEEIEFTVSKDRYGTVIENRSITPETVNRQDFEIGSGRIVANPTSLERSIYLGDDDEFSTLVLENVGAAYGTYQIVEVDYGFEPLYQPAPKPTISIPAFIGEIESSDEPASIFRDPKLTTAYEGPLTLELSPNAAKYGITQAPAATAAELLSDQLWYWEDLAVPTTYQNKGSTGAATSLFAGDFLGNDYSKLYAISYDNGNMYTIDTETAAATVVDYVTRPSGTTYSGLTGANGHFYGVATQCGTKSVLTKVYTDASMEEIGPISGVTCLIDIVYIPSENMLYGVDLVDDMLWMIDPETAVATAVGSVGVNANYAQGMDYDEANDIFYWASYHSIPDLRVIDRTTGASESIGAFPSGTEIDSYAIHAYGGGGGGAIPWLDEDPIEGVIDAGKTANIQLTWSVKDIDQPGDYFGELRIKTDTPFEIPPIPVTLHVWRPYNFGNFKGTVLATEKCDLNPAPAAEVTINFYRDGELHKSTVTGDDGYYSYSVQSGTYDVEFVLDGYVTGRIDGIVLGNSEDVVVDYTMRHDSPCLTYTPEFVYQELYPNQLAEQFLTFTNVGAQDAIFEISEIVGESAVPYGKEVVELILDDGSVDNGIGIGGTHPFIWVNRFTPTAEQYPFTLNRVDIYWDSTGNVLSGDDFEILIYKNTSGNTNPAVGAEFISKQTIKATTLDNWQSYELDEPVFFEGPGDVIIGVAALEIPGTSYWPASIDTSSTKSRSWIGWWVDPAMPDPPILPPDESWMNIDEFLPGNWMLRGYGETGGGTPGDIPWLSEDPTAGVVFADGGEVDVTLSFDATDLVWGDYFGALSIANAPDPKITIPVQLRILPFNMIYLPLIQVYFAPPVH